MQSIVQRAIHRVQALANERQVRIDVDSDGCDTRRRLLNPDTLENALTHLLSESICRRDANPHVFAHILIQTTALVNEEALEVSVVDNGRGYSAEEIATLIREVEDKYVGLHMTLESWQGVQSVLTVTAPLCEKNMSTAQ